MSYTPSASQKPANDNRKTIYGILIAALVLTWGYIIYDKSKTKETVTQKDAQITTVTSARDSIKLELDKAADRLDSLTGSNVQLQGALAEKNSELLKMKSNISSILRKKNATDAELAEAKKMIADLNGKIDGYVEEINKLKGENQQLTAANQQLTTDKNQLTSQNSDLQNNLSKTQAEKANIEDLASTLHASNINVTAMHVKGNGKETETSSAKRADLFVISCTLDENRVTPSGKKSLYVCVYNPDGTPSGTEGTFKQRDGSDKPYTNRVEVNYEQSKPMAVSFQWKPGNKFQEGNYKIEIYHNGFKIGEGTKNLKKGGFLGL
jgi:predicted nuclease with TOPRIM domain